PKYTPGVLSLLPTEAVNPFQQSRKAIGTMQVLDVTAGRLQIHAGSGNPQGPPTIAPNHRSGGAGAAEAWLGNADDRGGAAQGLEQVPAQTGGLFVGQPDVAVNHDGLNGIGHLAEHGKQTGQFAAVEFARLVGRYL